MKKRELSDNVIDALDATLSETVEFLEKFNVSEYWEKSFHVPQNPKDTTTMIKYIDRLKQAGLDIGKGNHQFGYKMPLPQKDTSVRYLQIFKRR